MAFKIFKGESLKTGLGRRPFFLGGFHIGRAREGRKDAVFFVELAKTK